jgi:hypothetical protein
MTPEATREAILAFLTHEQERLRSGDATPPFKVVMGHLVINWLRARVRVWGEDQ